MKKKQYKYVILISIIFIVSFSLSYAFFGNVFNINDGPNDIITETGTLNLTYTDGPQIIANNIRPGWSTTKTISIENTGSLTTYYSINWYELTNTITNDELIISGTCSSNIGECNDISTTVIGTTPGIIKDNISISSGTIHTYTINISFLEMSSLQNYNQGKMFNGVLRISESVKAFTLRGKVFDSNNELIPNAIIEIHSNLKTGVTASDGTFEIEGIPVGEHNIIVKNSHEISLATDDLHLLNGNVTTINNNQITVSNEKEIVDVEIVLSDSSDISMSLMPIVSDKLLLNLAQSDEEIDFSQKSSLTNGQGLYYTSNLTKTEGGKRVYYYRGAVENNYVVFAGFCWRIVRTNEDGSIKLRYGGEPTVDSGNYACPQTKTSVYAEKKSFNSTVNNSNRYVGYMYGSAYNTYENSHKNELPSSMKTYLENWYIDNIESKGNNVLSNISDTIYCNDRTMGEGGTVQGTSYSMSGYSNINTLYAPARRVATNGPTGTTNGSTDANPSYKCSRNDDKFTVSNTLGNGKNNKPVGLLTIDEVSYAGGAYAQANSENFLNIATYYWTMSPYDYHSSSARMLVVSNTGGLTYKNLGASDTAILPVISIKSDSSIYNGNGSYNQPYIIK